MPKYSRLKLMEMAKIVLEKRRSNDPKDQIDYTVFIAEIQQKTNLSKQDIEYKIHKILMGRYPG